MRIRQVRSSDFDRIREIALKIWEGNDYLPDVFYDWIENGGFYALTLNSRLVGVTKMTMMPCNVIWLEGLRMDPDYQGRGLGEKLAQFIYDKAKKMNRDGRAEHIEFSTYYKNFASLHIGRKAGFRIIEKYFILSKQSDGNGELKRSIITGNDIAGKKGHIHAGWKMIMNCTGSIDWLNEHCNVYSVGNNKCYMRENDNVVNFTDYAHDIFFESVDEVFRHISGFNHIIIPAEHEDYIGNLKKRGFEFRDKPEEPNMFLLRYMS